MTSIPYLGCLISQQGIQPGAKKIAAIESIKAPTNVVELNRYFGMVTYLSKFLPSMSDTTECLRKLNTKE